MWKIRMTKFYIRNLLCDDGICKRLTADKAPERQIVVIIVDLIICYI